MASNNSTGANDRAKNAAMAQRMKTQGIIRRTALCPICYRMTSIPMDRHFYGGLC